MLILCLAALLVGAGFSPLMALPQFALGLMATATLGWMFAVACGLPLWHSTTRSLTLFALTQVGYALGLAGSALLAERRGRSTPRNGGAAAPLVRPSRPLKR